MSRSFAGRGRAVVGPVSVVIPTYRREAVLLETIDRLRRLEPSPAEILVVDQTRAHAPATVRGLESLERAGSIGWIQLPSPSIPRALNRGLLEASHEIVLFLDDDVEPAAGLVAAHRRAHAEEGASIVAGQVLQPGEEPIRADAESGRFHFASDRRQWVDEFMGGNVSMRRSVALALGGFDENFVHVAYRFEAEFSDRARRAGHRILFEPAASIRHLRAADGGTRAYGLHFATAKPSHAVGAYYHLLRSRPARRMPGRVAARPLRAIATRHHLRRPWWILPTLVAETTGLLWAIYLFARGARRLDRAGETAVGRD